MEGLTHLALIWGGVLVAAFLAERSRLTPVLYYLAVGAVLVNVGLLPAEQSEFARGMGELGIVLIMFAIGFEEHADQFLRSVRRSWGIALFGALGPFACVYSLTYAFWGDFSIALICGLAMTSTAVSLTMIALRAEGLGKSLVCTRIMTSAVLDHIASLALLAVMIPIAQGGTLPNPQTLLEIVAKAVCFFVLIVLLARWVLPHDQKSSWHRYTGLAFLNIRGMLRFDGGRYATLIVLLLALSTGLISHWFGFHPAVGAYMAGLIMREEYFDFRASVDGKSYEEVRKLVDNAAFTWIGPVFFVLLGANLIFDWALLVSIIPQTVLLIVALAIVQIFSASLAARYTGGMPFAASVLVGVGMLGRAEFTFVVLDIAYVQNNILTREAFYTLMVACFWLNISVPLAVRLWKPRHLQEQRQLPQTAL